MDQELLAVEASIDAHQLGLNEEGVWLFLAVLGCWSVAPDWMRLVALTLSLVLFGFRYQSYRPNGREFKSEFSLAEKRLRALEVDATLREDGLQRLALLKQERLGGLRPLYAVPGFVVGWLAWGATLINTFIGLWSSVAA
jgi:type VI protein secretion system component VasK